MKQYIDKSALVVEIKRILSAFENSDASVDRLRASTLIALLSFLDTLEVKEVDLEKSISDWLYEGLPNDEEVIDYIKETAKHFFELGLKAEKDLELSWEDIKTIDKLLNQCVDYSNPYQEVLKRFKVQKGE